MIIENFSSFEKEQQKVKRGDIEMYDVKGYYKYLTLGELFVYWYKKYHLWY